MTDPVDTFAALELSAPILRALADVGYETPSPIQAACIPHLRTGGDILGEAQTGTGKTAAFALPLLDRLKPEIKAPQILVLTPTRELAIQVAEAFQKYARYLKDFHVLPIYGGQSMVVQLRQLQRGAQVIVGTPGRVMDHLERKSLDLTHLQALVLDEADEMLRMGFIDDVEWILKHTPDTRQTALFSATMPDAIRRVAHTYLKSPREVKIKASTSTVAAITQRYWQVRGVNKLDALTRILEVEESFDAAIIFVRTKIATEELADKLEARGYAAAAINGDMNQGMRERVIEQLKAGTLDILVATDVAARGIDVPRITHVINYDIPYDTEAYVHRIGRTGRAGRQGVAILFVAPRERGMLRAIERATRQPIEQISLPTREDVEGRRIAQLKQKVLDAIEAEDMQYFSEVLGQLAEENDLSIEDIAPALLFMAQKERPLKVEEHGRGWDVATAPADAPRKFDGGSFVEGAAREQRPARQDYADARDHAPRERAPKHDFGQNSQSRRYRIEVGRAHGVMPKEIVGAIANEGGIDGRLIGQIDLFDEFSTVDLPVLPDPLLNVLKRTRVRGQAINIRALEEGERYEKNRNRPDSRSRDAYADRPRDNFSRDDRQPRPYRDRNPAPYSDARSRDSYPPRKEFERSGDRPQRSDQPARSFDRNSRFSQGNPQNRDGFSNDRAARNFGDAPPKRSFVRDERSTSARPDATRHDSREGDKPRTAFKSGKPKKNW